MFLFGFGHKHGAFSSCLQIPPVMYIYDTICTLAISFTHWYPCTVYLSALPACLFTLYVFIVPTVPESVERRTKWMRIAFRLRQFTGARASCCRRRLNNTHYSVVVRQESTSTTANRWSSVHAISGSIKHCDIILSSAATVDRPYCLWSFVVFHLHHTPNHINTHTHKNDR